VTRTIVGRQGALKTYTRIMNNAAMKRNNHYEAETCATGGYLCGHRHRTPGAAERCLPTVPRSQIGSMTQEFSMARVLWQGDGPDPLDSDELVES
jgi:hypothetical protein